MNTADNTDLRLNGRVVAGVVLCVLALIGSNAAFILTGRAAPDWIGNAVIAAIGGLLGYLSRGPGPQQHPGPTLTGKVDTVNVDQTTATSSGDTK